MSSSYGYGYNQSNYGYGSYQSPQASNTPNSGTSPSVGYGNTGGGGGNYYSQNTPTSTPTVGYGANNNAWSGYKQGGGAYETSQATPTTSSSVSYPGYYQFNKTPSQTGSYTNQTGSYTPNQSGSYSGQPQSGSYTPQSGSYTPNQTGSYTPNQTGSYTGQPQSGSYTGQPQTGSTTYYYPQTSSTGYQAYTGGTTTYQLYTYPQTSTTSYNPQSYTGGSYASLTPQQEQVVREYATGGGVAKGTPGNKYSQGKHFLKKKTYDSQQEYYCDPCKVACGSALTYQTHINGKNHKKRLQQLAKVSTQPAESQIRCDVCDIVCSSKESYLAHIKGNKHLKTVSLFRRLGKPLPTMTSAVQQDDGGVQVTGPRITFVGGKKLSSTGLTLESSKKKEPQVYPPGAPQPAPDPTPDTSEENADVEPVGENLVKPVKNDPRSPLSSFYCELCECFFNDAMAKLFHCKGRRHRINYKKKIDPTLKVEPPKSVIKSNLKKREIRKAYNMNRRNTKPSNNSPMNSGRDRKMHVLRQREAMALATYHHRGNRGGYHDNYLPRPPPRIYYEDERNFRPHDMWTEPPMLRNPADDKLVSSKYGQLYPTDLEMKVLQKTIQAIEGALKVISDEILVEKCKRIASEKGLLVKDAEIEKDESLRELKGVMRVGSYAINLLLKGNMDIQLVVMCASIPTRPLLHEVMESLPAKLHVSNSDQVYHVTADPKCSKLLIVTTDNEVTITVHIVLTSSVLKKQDEATVTPSSALDIPSCLAGLTALRQTKWFQGMCQGLPSLSITMRVLLDLCRRNPVWSVLNEWLILVLVQKCIVSASPDYSRPGDILRRVIECVASGVFLPGYPGLLDPCESDNSDVASSLTAQQRADITLSAQHFLRLIAFNQLHLILDVEPPNDYAPYHLRRRSLLEEEEGEGEEEMEGEGEGEKEGGEGEETKRFKLDHIQ